MIECSLSCFTLGLFALLPVIGLPMAILALNRYRRVKRGRGALWNPAQRYLFWGAFCARLGFWPIVIVAVVIAVQACFAGRG